MSNVTPFRRPPPRPVRPQQEGGLGFKTHRGKAVLVQLLTVAAFLLNFLPYVLNFLAIGGVPRIALELPGMVAGIAGALVAVTNRGQGMPWAATHHEHALRTLIIGWSIWILGSLLSYIHMALGVGTIFVHLGVAIWAVVRASIGLVLAAMRRPIQHPHGWLV
ncbi:MAG: hypothetical protein R3C16_05965 [Hyphomonadaceae bacterium]